MVDVFEESGQVIIASKPEGYGRGSFVAVKLDIPPF